MKLFKEGKYWCYRYQIGRVRTQKSTGLTVKGQAETVAMAAFTEAKMRSRGQEPVPTLSALVERWLDTHQPRTEEGAGDVSSGHYRNIQFFGRDQLFGLGVVKLDRITTEMVLMARNQYLAGKSESTADQWLRHLNLIGNWAVKLQIIGHLPWRVKKINPPKKPKTILPLDKVQGFLAAVDASDRDPQVCTAVRLMIGLGLRESEVLKSRWEWIDWETKTYSPGFAKGKDVKPVPIPFWLLAHLKVIWGDTTQTGFILPNKDGKPHSKDFTRRAMKAANKKLNIKGLSPHRMRGTWITQLLRAGTPLEEVRKMARHKSVTTTLGYYGMTSRWPKKPSGNWPCKWGSMRRILKASSGNVAEMWQGLP